MNIIQAAYAVKTGKKLRRPTWFNKSYFLEDCESIEVSIDDILANDWEIEGRKIEITESEFDDIATSFEYEQSYVIELKKRLFRE
jgi:hypothetical protein